MHLSLVCIVYLSILIYLYAIHIALFDKPFILAILFVTYTLYVFGPFLGLYSSQKNFDEGGR